MAEICGNLCSEAAVIVSKENQGALWKKAQAQENSDAQEKEKKKTEPA